MYSLKRKPVQTILGKIPGLDSYRARYAAVSLLACLALMSIAYLSWNQFSQTTESQISAIAQRSETTSLLVDVQGRLNLLETYLQRIVIEPKTDDIDAVMRTTGELDVRMRTLVDFLGPGVAGVTDSLIAKTQHLSDEVAQLLQVRQEVDRWFPAMRLLREEMYPTSQAMLGELQGLMQEAENGASVGQQLALIESVTNLRRIWFAMVEEMHHFIAYRFGVFVGDGESANIDYSASINYLADKVGEHLAGLRLIYTEEAFGLDSARRMEQLELYYLRWLSASKQVFVVMDDKVWRRDLQLLRENITPILSSMHEQLAQIDLRLDEDSAFAIKRLTQTARRLSESTLSIALVGMLLILGAYLYINRNLLKPIAQTALALKEEARGAVDVRPPPAHLRETRDLVEAFGEMRRQVHQRQRYLDHIAHHDALTQLPNRALFRDRLEHALEIALRGESQVGLMFLDLDQFKHVNDSLGHLVGDELLRTVAERLVSLVRNSDTVARLGGDEFAILVEGIAQRDDMSVLAEKILHVVEQPMVLDGQQLQTSVSIGIATAPHDDISAEYLIRDADAAMYEAKRQGRADYRFFSGELTSKATEALLLENQVRQAAETGEYTFHFQPIISGVTGELFGFEALLRWEHPTRGMLYPDEFFTVLDQTGVITTVIDPLLEQAISFQQEQLRQHGEKVVLAINLSVRLLNDTRFRKRILERLIARDFLPESLLLEITEDTLMQDLVDAEVFLQQAKTLGARVALDDFGTGQSSLSHLRQFPFDFIKIDREFIRHAETDKNDASLVQAIVQLGHAFGIQVIAEGVEKESQLAFLQSLGCDYLQGYFIGLPKHAEHMVEFSQLAPMFEP